MLEGKMRNTAMSSNVGSARANPGWVAAALAVCACATCAVGCGVFPDPPRCGPPALVACGVGDTGRFSILHD